jgi:hypothetical protein
MLPAATPWLADAFFKGNALVAFGAVMLGLMVATAVGFGFLLRWLHRHIRTWWRVPALVGSWVMLLGSLNAVFILAYAMITGDAP